MYCPSCGTETSTDIRFCRSCGFSLQRVSEIVSGKSPGGEADSATAEAAENAPGQRQKLFRWGFITIWATILLVALGQTGDWMDRPQLINGGWVEHPNFFWYALHSLGNFAPVVLAIGVGLLLYSFLLPKAQARTAAPHPKALPRPELKLSLEPEQHRVSVPSVTENTTELLEKSDARASGRTTAPQNE